MLACCIESTVFHEGGGREGSTDILLESLLRIIQCPAYTLEVGADIEQIPGIRVKACKDPLFPYRYPQIC
jgi:hypothetical protein